MVKLYDIYSYFDCSGCYMFDKNYDWYGKILLNEAGWFEGIISYSNDKKVKNNICNKLFIYGIFIPGQGIKIVESIPYRENSILRNIGIGTYILDVGNYKGFRTVGIDMSQRNYGVAKIVVEEVDNICSNDVSKKIVELRKNLVEVRNKFIYKDLYRVMYKDINGQKDKIIRLKKKGLELGYLNNNHSPARLSRSRKIV